MITYGGINVLCRPLTLTSLATSSRVNELLGFLISVIKKNQAFRIDADARWGPCLSADFPSGLYLALERVRRTIRYTARIYVVDLRGRSGPPVNVPRDLRCHDTGRLLYRGARTDAPFNSFAIADFRLRICAATRFPSPIERRLATSSDCMSDRFPQEE